MKKLNQKLLWLVVALPLTGCGSLTSIPLYEVKPEIKHVAPVVDFRSNSISVKVESKGTNAQEVSKVPDVHSYPVENAVIEVKKVELASSQSKVPSVVGVDPINPEDVKDIKAQVGGKQVSVDQSVKLIAPPTALPRTKYALPQVEEKEDYVPTKHASKSSKKGKASVKNSKKQKAGASKKSTKEKTVKSTTKKSTKKPSKTKK